MPLLKKNYAAVSDEDLMTEIAQKNPAAFDELYARYSQRLLIFFYRMLGCEEGKAQDFLQDIFFKIVDRPQAFQHKKSFASWIFTVAANMCKNEYRNRAVRNRVSSEEDMDIYEATQADLLDHAIDDAEFKGAIFRALAQVSPEKQSTFLLRFQEQFSIKEISKILGCSEGTVKSRLFYTTKYLADRLKAYAP